MDLTLRFFLGVVFVPPAFWLVVLTIFAVCLNRYEKKHGSAV